jgi:hypothetical protein
MTLTEVIRHHMRVVGSDGNFVGLVERVEGGQIKLARNHVKAGGIPHWVPLDWVEAVNGVVILDRDSNQAHREWRSSRFGTTA